MASSGDGGAISDLGTFGSSTPVKEVSLPASDPLVLAVGGTSLTANPVTGAYVSETALNTLPQLIDGHSQGSGGGFSHLFARPAYQDGVPGIGAMRGVPDVAGDGSSSTGMAFVFAAPGGAYALLSEGGTSAAAPFWAGLIALADQEAGHPLGFVNPAIYQIARGPLYRQGVPRHHHRQQHRGRQRGHDHRLPGRTRLGPGHRLGDPRRASTRAPARPLRHQVDLLPDTNFWVTVRADEKLLLLAHPRSGSSNLYEILQMHPALEICDEPFNENFPSWSTGNKNYRELSTTGLPSKRCSTRSSRRSTA